MTLPGPSRKIIVQPIEEPRPARRSEERPTWARAGIERGSGRRFPRGEAMSGGAGVSQAKDRLGPDPPLIASRIHGVRVWMIDREPDGDFMLTRRQLLGPREK